MPSALQLIADVRNLASSGPASVDFRISDDQILFWINQVRSMLINQAIQKRQDYSDTWIQTINCLELEPVDEAECCDFDSGCYILKSVRQLPSSIETDAINTIMKVSGLDGTSFAKINPFRARFRKYNKYTGSSIGWYIKNNYLYIVNNIELSKVNIVGLFENPMDLANFTNCSGSACFSLESDYPVSLKMGNEITNYIFNTKIKPFMSEVQDKTNNASDSTRPINTPEQQ